MDLFVLHAYFRAHCSSAPSLSPFEVEENLERIKNYGLR